MKRRRKDNRGLEAAGQAAAETGVAVLSEFPPIGIAVAVVAGIGVLGFLAWKGFSRMSAKKNIG